MYLNFNLLILSFNEGSCSQVFRVVVGSKIVEYKKLKVPIKKNFANKLQIYLKSRKNFHLHQFADFSDNLDEISGFEKKK